MAATSIRQGDTVQVISGKDKGLTGTVIKVFPKEDRLIVEGVNWVKKHRRDTQGERGASSGGIITTEAPIHVSNVQLVDPSDNRPTRIGARREEVEKQRSNGTTYQAERSVRVSKRTGKDLV